MACVPCSFLLLKNILLELPDAVDCGYNPWCLFYSASTYYWEGGGGGHWHLPVWQQPHPQVHRSWVSHTCTNWVAVDVQRGLSRGLPVSHTEKEREWTSFCVCPQCSHVSQSLIVNRLLIQERNSCFRDVDTNKRGDNESALWPDTDQRMWFMLFTMSIFRRTSISQSQNAFANFAQSEICTLWISCLRCDRQWGLGCLLRCAVIWWIERRRRERGGCFDHPYLLPAHQSQIFLIPALCFLLFLSRSLSKKKEAFSCWSCSSSWTLSFSLSRTPFIFEKIVDKHFLCFLIWIDSCVTQQKQKGNKRKQTTTTRP